MIRLNYAVASILSAALFFISANLPAEIHHVTASGERLAIVIEKARNGDTIELEPGHYLGPLIIRTSITLKGKSGSIIDGEGRGHVILVDAPQVTIESLQIENSGQLLSEEHSGIFITQNANGAVIRNNELKNNLIGVYLKGPSDAQVVSNTIIGLSDLRVNERGNGVQLWNSPGSIIIDNHIEYGRDGIFATTSRNNRFSGNYFSNLRFAVHYMYTNHSEISNNISEGNHVGFALMYSSQLKVTGNISRKDRDRGIFFNFANTSKITNNRVDGGVEKCAFIYNSNMNQIVRNHFEGCKIGIHFTAGSEQNEIWGNNFIGNRTQVKYVGTRELEWSRNGEGNYWSDHLAFDLNGDGVADKPYRPNTIVDQLVWRHPTAKILLNSPALQLLQWAQSQFPALHPGGVQDSVPLMQPSSL
ncbi:MAG: nitrous oxide reductase family maturation protein NosD [Pseudomonadales bacterium]|nr:nitrous oxide reductase family maturation protein NosD [Pseudomonadales bacterium]